LLVVDEHGDLLLGVHALEQRAPAAVEPIDDAAPQGLPEEPQLLVEAGVVLGEPFTKSGRTFPPFGRDLGQRQTKLNHVLGEAQRRIDVAVLGRDHVHDRAGRNFARSTLEVGIRDRFQQDLEVEGKRDERSRHRLQKRTLRVVHGQKGQKSTTPAYLSSSIARDGPSPGGEGPPPPPNLQPPRQYPSAASRAAAAVSRKSARGPRGSSSVKTGSPRSTPSHDPNEPGVG